MKPIEAVLTAAPGLSGAARADDGGNVLEIAGTLDGESLCAVATMCKPPLENIAQILGLGPLRDWSFSYGQGALYVHHGRGAHAPMTVVAGAPTKGPEATMKKIAAVITSGDGS